MVLERSSIRSSSSSSSSASCSSSTNCRSKFSLFHTLCVFFLCFFLYAFSTAIIAPTSPSPYISNSYTRRLETFYAQEERRKLRGMGSTPPRCNGKCERCRPCKAVHVTVPPGTPVTAQYYPEAWRCKCGNRFYMP